MTKQFLKGEIVIDIDIKDTLWKIDCDGYYPYCPKCEYEPQDGKLTYFCVHCGADLRKNKEIQCLNEGVTDD